jgi:hypothetical protein
MQSKLSRNSSSIVSERSMDRARKANLKRASPRCRKRRVTRSLRKTLESGVSSTTTLGTTLMNVAQYSHWWSSSKTKSRTPTWTLIQKIIKGGQIIDAEPTATIATATIQPEEDPEEGERLFHSQMWVKGTPLHFIVDSGSQKNIISEEVVKQLYLPTTPHPQPYNIGWLRQGQDLHFSQQCRMSYDIKPFKDEVLCDVAPLEFYDVLLGQPYMWRHHVVYESRPHNVIVTLGIFLYWIPEVVPTIVPPKQCHKVISHTAKFSLFTIRSEGEHKDIATTAALSQDLSI